MVIPPASCGGSAKNDTQQNPSQQKSTSQQSSQQDYERAEKSYRSGLPHSLCYDIADPIDSGDGYIYASLYFNRTTVWYVLPRTAAVMRYSTISFFHRLQSMTAGCIFMTAVQNKPTLTVIDRTMPSAGAFTKCGLTAVKRECSAAALLWKQKEPPGMINNVSSMKIKQTQEV